jgi:hypothetical protein
MDIDRGALARIDRKLLAGLPQNATSQMVRVPLSAAAWSTWKRYCDAIGMRMGRAVAALIAIELGSVIGATQPVDRLFGDRSLAAHAAALEEQLGEKEKRLQSVRQRLAERDEQVRHLQLQLRAAHDELTVLRDQTSTVAQRVGRNARCPCGSGLKYKFCEALAHRAAPRS